MQGVIDIEELLNWTYRVQLADLILGDIDDRWVDFLGDPEWPLPNVWEGTSVEDHDTAQVRIRHLQQVPAAVRWISFEPMLGPIDCTIFGAPSFWKGIHWCVAGGESGRGARPMHPDWPRWVRDRCQIHGIAFFFKQWGEWVPIDFDDLASEMIQSEEIAGRVHGFEDQPMHRVGKKAAGRRLDGVEWTMWPEAQ